MEKPTAKELKEALNIVAPLTRDRLNAAVGLKQEIASLERVRDALAVAHRLAVEDSASNEKTASTHAHLTEEISGLEKTAKQLRADTAETKKLWQSAQEQLGATRKELAQLEEQVAAAKAVIARGEETQKILASLASH